MLARQHKRREKARNLLFVPPKERRICDIDSVKRRRIVDIDYLGGGWPRKTGLRAKYEIATAFGLAMTGGQGGGQTTRWANPPKGSAAKRVVIFDPQQCCGLTDSLRVRQDRFGG